MTGTSPFLSLFRRSPFKPMQEHIRVVRRCAGEVPSLIEAMVAGDRDAVEAAKDKIFILEKAADEIKNQLRSHLPASLLMPVDRRDLLEILHLQDAIADTAQDIAGLLVIRPLDVPPDLAAPLRVFTARCASLRPAARLYGPLRRRLRCRGADRRGIRRIGRDRVFGARIRRGVRDGRRGRADRNRNR